MKLKISPIPISVNWPIGPYNNKDGVSNDGSDGLTHLSDRKAAKSARRKRILLHLIYSWRRFLIREKDNQVALKIRLLEEMQ